MNCTFVGQKNGIKLSSIFADDLKLFCLTFSYNYTVCPINSTDAAQELSSDKLTVNC